MGLTDEDLRDAAAEAGISPNELRHELARRDPGALATTRDGSVVGPPRRGESATHVEGPLAAGPDEALAAVRESIERQTTLSGHRQGDGSVDIVDDRAGVTYRIRAAEDGAGGALVRVDVDPSQSKGTRALALTGIGGTTALVLIVGWMFSATTLLLGGLGLGVLGAMWLARSLSAQRGAVRGAHAVASRALGDAEQHVLALPAAAVDAPGALPPASDTESGEAAPRWRK